MKEKVCATCLYIGNPSDSEPCMACIENAKDGEVFSGWRSLKNATEQDVRMVTE